jgi:hypothetical protein
MYYVAQILELLQMNSLFCVVVFMGSIFNLFVVVFSTCVRLALQGNAKYVPDVWYQWGGK